MKILGRKNRNIEDIEIIGEDILYFYAELKPGKWLIEAF